MFHCPACDKRLRVPSEAAGRSARCPSCKTKFRLPNESALLEDSVLDLLYEDPDDEFSPGGSGSGGPGTSDEGQKGGSATGTFVARSADTRKQQDQQTSVAERLELAVWKEAAQAIPDQQTLRKFASWFEFERGERFVMYLKDWSRATSATGLMLTTRRIAYGAPPHHGTVPLNADGFLVGYRHAGFLEIHYRHFGRERPMARVSNAEAQRLQRALAEMKANLNVMLA